MVGRLILKHAQTIDQAILKSKIPVWFNVLRMHHIDDLLRIASKQVTQFRIGSCSLKKPDLIQPDFIRIKSVKPGIPAAFKDGVKTERTGGKSQVAQVGIIGRNGKTFIKINNG